MVKCEFCGEKIPRTFLNKLVGTVFFDDRHKKHYVCAKCQKEYSGKDLNSLLKDRS